MFWPLMFAMPDDTVNSLVETKEKLRQQILTNCNVNGFNSDSFEIITIPEKVVAVGRFSEAIVEPVVRKVQKQLYELCTVDGLQILQPTIPSEQESVTFAQYDAVYSMGKRRSEVHVELEPNRHPWV